MLYQTPLPLLRRFITTCLKALRMRKDKIERQVPLVLCLSLSNYLLPPPGLRKVSNIDHMWVQYLIHPFSAPGESSPALPGIRQGTNSDLRTDVMRSRTIIQVQREVADTHVLVSEIHRTVMTTPKEGSNDKVGLVRFTRILLVDGPIFIFPYVT